MDSAEQSEQERAVKRHVAPRQSGRPLGFLLAVAFSLAMVFCSIAPGSVQAEVVAMLSEARVRPLERKFEVDLSLSFSADLVGGDLEFVNLDVINSRFNSVALTTFNLIEFAAAAPLDSWQAGSQIGGNSSVPSQVMLDSFASGASGPLSIADTSPITIGTFTFNYQPLNLVAGDTVTLDVVGVDEGAPSMTTSVAFREPADSLPKLFDPTFAPGSRTIVVTAVPEPKSIVVLAMLWVGLFQRRRRR